MANYFFIPSKRGRDLLVYEGFTYSLARTSNNGTEYYKCVRLQDEDCPGRCTLYSGDILELSEQPHTHPAIHSERPEFPSARREQQLVELRPETVAVFQSLATKQVRLGQLRGKPGLAHRKQEAKERFIFEMCKMDRFDLNLAQTTKILRTKMTEGPANMDQLAKLNSIKLATEFMLDDLVLIRPLTVDNINMLHTHALSHKPLASGRFRQGNLTVNDFEPPSFEMIPEQMAELVEWLNASENSGMNAVQLAARAHHQLVFLHPYCDGNGRCARLLLALLLVRAGYPILHIPSTARWNYFNFMRMANEGDTGPFVKYIAKILGTQMDEMIAGANIPFLTDI